jgi:hypothetical protein
MVALILIIDHDFGDIDDVLVATFALVLFIMDVWTDAFVCDVRFLTTTMFIFLGLFMRRRSAA